MANLENFDDMFENLFNSKDYELFNRITKTSIDVLGLRKTGDVEILEQEEDGLVIKTVSYKSFCGKYNFTKVFTYLKEEETLEMIKQLDEKIAIAVEKEDYETAAQLKKEKEQLTSNK